MAVVELGTVCKEILKSLDTSAVSLPVSIEAESGDSIAIETLLGGDVDASHDTDLSVEGLLERIATCRIVVTGSYHAGVFALSQGIPVVALCSSDYYRHKMQGLALQFPSEAIRCVDLQGDDYERLLSESVHSAWTMSTADRLAIHTRAGAIAELCASRWSEFADLVRA